VVTLLGKTSHYYNNTRLEIPIVFDYGFREFVGFPSIQELRFSAYTIVAQGSTLGARQVVFSITRPPRGGGKHRAGVTRVRSHSIRGAGEISITFAPGTNMDQALQLVRARAEPGQERV